MKAALAVVSGALAVVYPALVYYGLTRWGTQCLGGMVCALVALRAVLSLGSEGREHLASVLRSALPIAVLAGVSAAIDDRRFLLAMPVLVNLSLLATFGASLRGETSMVERFARMRVSDLSDAERSHCRATTVAWCCLFAFNALASGLLALAAPLAWWALYTGLVAYGLVGLLFAAEFLVRTYRFRARRRNPADRLFARLFPVPT